MRMRSATVFARSKISNLSSISCSLFPGPCVSVLIPFPWSLFPVCGCRYYDPQTGTFTSRDSYLDQKPYLYCEHNPVSAVDPSGHMSIDIWAWITNGGSGYNFHFNHDDWQIIAKRTDDNGDTLISTSKNFGITVGIIGVIFGSSGPFDPWKPLRGKDGVVYVPDGPLPITGLGKVGAIVAGGGLLCHWIAAAERQL